MHQTAIALLAVAFVQPPQVRYSSWHSAAASFCCSSPRFTLSKIFSRSRSFALITKSPSICPPFRVQHPRGLFYSVSQRAFLYSYHNVSALTLTFVSEVNYLACVFSRGCTSTSLAVLAYALLSLAFTFR